jgi:hypothetical protein
MIRIAVLLVLLSSAVGCFWGHHEREVRVEPGHDEHRDDRGDHHDEHKDDHHDDHGH